ncbi:MAG: FAD-binding oxidoreductase [Azonexus sp.]|jgi:FAD/FMN-containing dehydrogenase|nr:FAD-binding oxidoreductase [Azonexus sp.]
MSEPLIQQLAAITGPTHVLTDAGDVQPWLTDWRGRYRGAARCLVRPGTRAEVAAVVAACAAVGAPMVPQGGNTSLCGAATPDLSGAAVVINLSRLNRILAVDPVNDSITVEAGCTLAAVQAAARAAGRFFPLALASSGSCQIGGNLSTNAGGVQVLRYGNVRELTLGLEVVLADGAVWNGLRGLRKDNTGYDLKQLFIGAEGTLGVITAAVLKLFALPAVRTTCWLNVATPAAAVDLLRRAKDAFDAQLTAFELISETALGLVLRHLPGERRQRPSAPSPWYILAEFSGSDPAAVENWLAARLAEQTVSDGVIARSEAQAEQLWALRENISEAQKIEGLSIKHDIAVPVSRIPEFLARAESALTRAFPGLRIVAFGHVGDGNLHYNLSQPAGDNAAFIDRQPAVHRLVHDIVQALDGSISAEHGLGQLKRDEIRRYKSAAEMALMRSIKQALDPRGLMNPGKVL